MYHMITAKNRAHLGLSQNRHDWEAASESADFVSSALGPFQRFKQQRGLSGADGLADLFEPGDCDTCPSPEPDCVAAALCQQRLDTVR